MGDLLNVSVNSGKYTIIQNSKGGLRALRYGEEWQDLTGNGMVLALAQEVDMLRKLLSRVEVHLDMSDRYDSELYREIEIALGQRKE